MSTDQTFEAWKQQEEEKRRKARRKTPSELRRLAASIRKLWT